jgi:hypothetical protein
LELLKRITFLAIILAFKGNLKLATFKAFFDTRSGAPLTSKIIVPFFTIAIQPLIEPQPLPIRLSNGFFVIGRLKKILINIVPIRFVSLEITLLVASNCLAVKTPLAADFNP